jgi:hypothetical protein
MATFPINREAKKIFCLLLFNWGNSYCYISPYWFRFVVSLLKLYTIIPLFKYLALIRWKQRFF